MQNCRKDNANGNGTDDGREEADSAQIVAQVELPVQKYGQRKTKANLSDSRHNRKNDRIEQRPLDAGIADNIFVVHKPDKVRSGKVPVCKGIPDADQHRQDEKDAVNQNAGRHKQRGIALVLIHTSQFPRYTEGRLPSIRLADALAVVNDCV